MITILDLKNCPNDEAIMELIEAEREQYAGLVEAMKRLASIEAFALSRTMKSPYDDELIDRIKYAEESVKPFMPPPKLSEELAFMVDEYDRGIEFSMDALKCIVLRIRDLENEK